MLVEYLEKHQLSCFFKSQFGLECLGCGTQRAIIDLLQGNLKSSFIHQPAVILFIIYVFIILLFWRTNTIVLKKVIQYGFGIIISSIIFRFFLHF
jgi:hypothetical protein